MPVRFPLSLGNVEDLLHERGIDVIHETVRYWWNRFGPVFASELRRRRDRQLRAYSICIRLADRSFLGDLLRMAGCAVLEQEYFWRKSAKEHQGYG